VHKEMINYKDHDLRSFLLSIPPNEIEVMNRKQDEDNLHQYKRFKNALAKNKCFLCNHSLNSFVNKDPCFHWLLLPDGITKKELIKYLNSEISFYNLESYLRWMANTDTFLGNINDLEEEKPEHIHMVETIRYKHLEWTLQISNSDKNGHCDSIIGKKPHYHIQILRNNKIYLKFNDCHIFLTDQNLFHFECSKQAGDIYKIRHSYGEGYSELEYFDKTNNLDEFDKTLKVSDNPEKAQFRRQTFIEAPAGKSISGELLAQAFEESNKTKEPVGRIIHRLNNELKITTMITPSENIPDIKKRNQR